jgi:hypothetical protein
MCRERKSKWKPLEDEAVGFEKNNIEISSAPQLLSQE